MKNSRSQNDLDFFVNFYGNNQNLGRRNKHKVVHDGGTQPHDAPWPLGAPRGMCPLLKSVGALLWPKEGAVINNGSVSTVLVVIVFLGSCRVSPLY